VKIGDLVMFTKEYSSRSGFGYCENWIGIVVEQPSDGNVYIHWTCPGNRQFKTNYEDTQGLEVVNASR
jgi:hypothetical protein